MKLTKQLEKDVRQVYLTYWESYFSGNLRKFASLIDADYKLIGTSEIEILNGKQAALQWLKSSVKEIKGKAEFRNRKIKLSAVNELVLVTEQADAYVHVGRRWMFYSKIRVSTLLRQTGSGWKVVQQHGSMPDPRTGEGETVSFETLSRENLQLRDAVKRRTAELENKNRELEIETALEKVRAISLGMKEPADMLDVCKTISLQLQTLGVKDIRNVQTAIFYETRGTYMNYEYYAKHKKTFITETIYTDHKIAKAFAAKMLKGKDEIYVTNIKGEKKVKEWLAYQKKTNVFIDRFLEKASSLNYYWHSLGPVALGISAYRPLSSGDLNLFNRFLKVFELAYRRYLDIEKAEAQAKEARIELALERVRARAMAMQHSNELADLVAVVFRELTGLGFTLTSSIIWIHDHIKGSDTLWIASPEMNKPANPYLIRPFEKDFFASVTNAWKSRDPKWVYTLTGGGKKKFEKAFFKEIPGLPPALIHALRDPRQVVFSASFNQFGALEIVETEALTDEKFDILHRFGKVFDSSYTRFNDLKKAEAQAREAQIEAALERVRSRGMAMHKSEELLEAGEILCREMSKLGIGCLTSGYVLMDADAKIGWNYTPHPATGKIMPEAVGIPHTETKEMKQVLASWKKQEPVCVIAMNEAQTIAHQTFIAEKSIHFPLSAKELIAISPPKLVLHNFNFKEGYLLIVGGEKLTDEQLDIMLRFTRVFQQTYTRFLDLQKAEAQAREAQIEAALERVRSATMAMQKSDELQKVVHTVFERLKELKVDFYSSIIILFAKGSRDIVWWFENSENQQYAQIAIPYTNISYLKDLFDAKESGKGFFSKHYPFREKNKLFEYLFNHTGLRNIPEKQKKFLRETEFATISAAIETNTGIHITSYSRKSIAKQENEILIRFAKVFEQTYTRFLDLQNAEAQAREAQIEAALERVRAKVMAMNSSKDLPETSLVFGEQLRKLGIDWQFSYFWLIEEDKDDNTFWITWPDSKTSTTVYSLAEADENFRECIIAWKEQVKIHASYVPPEGVKPWLETFERIKKDAGGAALEIMRPKNFKKGVYYFDAMIRFGSFGILINRLLSEEEMNIQARFATEFERAYTRFLDLQKAESQTREAQIELGLERVRARAMAMQRSDELAELVDTVFRELTKLDMALTWCMINVIDESSLSNTVWTVNAASGKIPESFHMKFEDYPFHHAMMKGWKGRATKYVYVLEGREKKVYDEYLFSETEFRKVPAAAQATSRAMEKYVCSFSFSNFGGLQTVGNAPLSEGSMDILSRFGKVFDLTYTRFNDLKQAEAQARESEIQLALERVRARTMAMQKSDELSQAANLLFQQVQALGMPAWSAGYCTWDEDLPAGQAGKKAITLSMSSEGVLQPSLRMPLTEDPSLIHFLEAHERGETFFVEELGGEELKKHYVYLRTLPGVKETLDDIEKAGFPVPTFQIFHLAYFSKGFLLFITYEPVPDAWDIFKRFAAVFEQTYTRFLDLQKAEAQAREAQIEAALERVRSRTMAMHKSKELAEVSALLYKELQGLGVTQFLNCGYVEIDEVNHIQNAWMTNADGLGFNVVQLPLTGDSVFDERYEAWKRKDNLIHQVAGGDVLKNHIELGTQHYRKTEIDELVRTRFPDPTIFYCGNFNYGYLNIITGTPLTEEQESLLIRFTKVFEMTYGRFLDLQKAEAQAREAQIELSLERVRARTMAMHKSEELVDTSVILFQELRVLGVKAIRTGVAIIDDEKELMELWSSQLIEQKQNKVLGLVPMQSHPFFQGLLKAWREKDHDYTFEFNGEKVKEFYETMSSLISYPVQNSFNLREIFSPFFFPEGSLTVVSHEPLTNEERNIMQRFARVFGLLYRRFLDLQKAEAQAREAQIEAALERVRSRTMGMQKSEELKEVIQVVYEQFVHLNILVEHAGFIMDYKERDDMHIWLADRHEVPFQVTIPYFDCAHWNSFIVAKKQGWDFFANHLGFEEKNKFYQELFTLIPVPVDTREYYFNCPALAISTVLLENVGLYIENFSGIPYSDEENNTLMRFGKVFQQTYTRFLDLQKAEAQAREAKIEAALERTRTQSMLMQHSEQLDDTLRVFHEQVLLLGIKSAFSFLWLPDEKKDRHIFWAAWAESHLNNQPGESDSTVFKSKAINYPLDRNEPATAQCLVDWKSDQPVHAYHVPPAEVDNYFAAWKELLDGVEKLKPEHFRGGLYYVEAFMKYGCFGVMIEKEMPEEEKKLLGRFAIEFERTYTRFLDLQRAEAQAREAQIEAALEKVRSRSLAMHRSEELEAVIMVVSEQLQQLQFRFHNVSFTIISDELDINFWLASPGQAHPFLIKVPYLDNPMLNRSLEGLKSGTGFISDVLTQEENQQWLRHALEHSVLKDLPDSDKHFLLNTKSFARSQVLMKHIILIIGNYAGVPYTDEQNAILKRFGNVFEQAYTRFLDLEKAEAQAREALIEAALERVRSKAMAMHSSDDLALTVDTFFSELKSLHVMPRRCGVTLIDKESRIADLTLTTATQGSESKKVMAKLKLSGHPVLDAVFDNWKLQQEFHPRLQGDEIREYYKVMNSQVALPDFTGDEKQYGHYFFFKEGGVFAWTDMELADDEMRIFRRFTSVLSLTYKRYKDLQQAEALAQQAEKDLILLKEEKTRTEEALAELQVTQKQLIQSEKMASLGELTAGIAHEIQNPLNFVNNFSEVSNELLDEMLEEAAKGNFEEVKEILNNVKQNLEKIGHHGKRADGIVKGMLQHSRSSSGQMEPTDINVLADEYLRLAYHGLRAKDKSFNATMKTAYDGSLPKVNIIPQDIGRVVLNLITNAFYVVNEKKNAGIKDYEPTVTISTKMRENKVELSVVDNGNGIPQKVLEKIFQPFFTTKPTGQGTGLGLSLSYDIVKAHGGEIKVETKEGEGTEFIVSLPL